MKKKNKKTILIVEDEVAHLSALADKFADDGFGVIKAKDGVHGLKSALKERPDLIVLDILMPKMDGMTMLKHLRKDAWGKGVPVVILTNLSETEKVAESMGGGTYDFLVKTDWSLNDVVAKVKERLGMTG